MPTRAIVTSANQRVTRITDRPRRSSRRRGRTSVSIAVLGGLVPLAMTTYNGWRQTQTLQGAFHNFAFGLTGYESVAGRWDPAYAMKMTWGPILIGALVHRAANRFGLNRALRLPWGIRI